MDNELFIAFWRALAQGIELMPLPIVRTGKELHLAEDQGRPGFWKDDILEITNEDGKTSRWLCIIPGRALPATFVLVGRAK
jgi:hypothetical protein